MQYLKLDKVLTFEGEDAVSFLDSLISNECSMASSGRRRAAAAR